VLCGKKLEQKNVRNFTTEDTEKHGEKLLYKLYVLCGRCVLCGSMINKIYYKYLLNCITILL